MSVPRSRLLDLLKVQCRIFSSTYNPEGLRLGNKILRQRLKGPALQAYYPRKMGTIQELEKALSPYAEIIDEDEIDREDGIRAVRARGKGPPKKKRTADESAKKKKKR